MQQNYRSVDTGVFVDTCTSARPPYHHCNTISENHYHSQSSADAYPDLIAAFHDLAELDPETRFFAIVRKARQFGHKDDLKTFITAFDLWHTNNRSAKPSKKAIERAVEHNRLVLAGVGGVQ